MQSRGKKTPGREKGRLIAHDIRSEKPPQTSEETRPALAEKNNNNNDTNKKNATAKQRKPCASSGKA